MNFIHFCLQDFFYSWVHLGTVKSEFVRTSSDENWLQLHNKNGYAPGCAYAMAVAIDRSIATDQELVFARVELGGTLARGMMVVDWGLVWGKANIQIVRSLDMGKIQGMLAAMVQDEAILEQY